MSQRAYVGVDLGGKFHQVQVTGADGSRVGRWFRIGRGRAGLAALRQGVSDTVGAETEAIYTIEATQNFWQELVHPLRRAGAQVYLVSPAKTTALRTFYRRHTKTDAIDATATSRLPTVDPTLHPVVVGDERFDALRRLVRQSLRSCLYLAAEIARHYDPELRAFHARLRARGKHYKQASCALAAKILRRCWAVLREQRAYVVEHHATLEQAKQKGKTIRESVHEVAERLNDGGGVPSPVRKAKSSAASDQSTPNSPAGLGGKRLRRRPAQPGTQPDMTRESSLAKAERGLSCS